MHRYLSCFQFLATMNRAAITMGMLVSLAGHKSGYTSESLQTSDCTFTIIIISS